MGRVVPKGIAMGLHLSPEYREGLLAAVESFLDPDRRARNPYGFFDAYSRHYAWEIGFQAAGNRIRELNLSAGEVRQAWLEGAEAMVRRLGLDPTDRHPRSTDPAGRR
jgi:hypothetical protein